MNKFLDTAEWKVTRNLAQPLSKSINAETEDAGDRRLKFTISTDDIDRYNDRVIQSGWKLNNYTTNGVVLFQHNESLVIGRCVEIAPLGNKLKATVEFLDRDTPHFGELADGVYTMLRGRFLNAVSVGFRVLDYEEVKDKDRPRGVDYTSMDLLEFSVVTIPALPQALLEPGQRSFVKTEATILTWADDAKRDRALKLIERLNNKMNPTVET